MLDTSKLVFNKSLRQAKIIMLQSNTGTAKMYPTTREDIIENIKRGRHLDKLQNFFTPESIEKAQNSSSSTVAKVEPGNKPKDNNAGKNS